MSQIDPSVLAPTGTWHISTKRPAEWSTWVKACGGSVFHTPAGLLMDGAGWTPVYSYLVSPAGVVVGVGIGSQHGCKFSSKERHLHLPTLPAFAPGVDSNAALNAFRSRLQDLGYAEVDMGSYDAAYVPEHGTAPRMEYPVPVPASGDIMPQLSSMHRRHVRRGDREGWTVRLLSGTEGTAAVLGVQRATAERASAHGRGFDPVRHAEWQHTLIASFPLPETGLVVLGAFKDDTLLASVLIGWAAERSFYLIGGSTPAGYRCGAAVWLHTKAIAMFAERGVRVYNLGGTPPGAHLESHPSHGLHRFKVGFGITPVERLGVRWVLRPGHERLHRIVGKIARRVGTNAVD